MPVRLKRLDLIEGGILTFVEVNGIGTPQIRTVSGRLEPSSVPSLHGYRFRFKDYDGRDANIGMIFPQGLDSQHGKDASNRVYRDKGKLVLEYAVRKCPGVNGCCQPWNNYLRFFST